LVDFVKDPFETDVWDTWEGVEALINGGVEEKFGDGTEEFLREANRRHRGMLQEIMRRYGLRNGNQSEEK